MLVVNISFLIQLHILVTCLFPEIFLRYWQEKKYLIDVFVYLYMLILDIVQVKK